MKELALPTKRQQRILTAAGKTISKRSNMGASNAGITKCNL